MFRRFISTLVLIGFVAGQIAAVPHAHAGYSPEEQQRHDAKPHVHVEKSAHSHGHQHSHDEHSHSHAVGGAVNVKSPGHAVCAPSTDHDTDAINFPSDASSLLAAKDQRTSTGADPNPSAQSGHGTFRLRPEPQCDSIPLHPPNNSSGAKLFLTLRTLRI